MQTKKILCVLLGFLLLFSFACKDSGGGDNSGKADNPGNSDGESETTQDPMYTDDLPERNYGGETFNILGWEQPMGSSDLIFEEQTGDIINDSIYLANRAVEGRFNVEFKPLTAPISDAPQFVKRAITSGDNAYDFALVLDRDALTLAMEGEYFYSMDKLPYVNLDKLYWDQQLKNDMTIENVLYFTYGANMLSAMDYICLLIYNKEMAAEMELESIYDLVREGKWTIDKMYEMAAAATADLDGNGTMTKDDRFGIHCWSHTYYPSFWEAEGIGLIAKNENDVPHFNVPGNQKLFDLFERLYGYAMSGVQYESDKGDKLFDNGRALFQDQYLVALGGGAAALEFDYGVIPYPTMAEKNPGSPYSARLALGCPIIVPVLAEAERASIIMESLACEYQKRVIPNYYEIATKVKGTRDEESIEILDMLTQNRFLDFGDTFWTWEVRAKYVEIFDNKTNDFQSVTDKITGNVEKVIENAINVFREANNG